MVKHILIRLGVLFIVPIVIGIMFSPSGTSDAMGNGMAKGFAAVFTFYVSVLLLIIGFIVDTIILYRKKQQEKVILNFSLVLFILIFGGLLFQIVVR